MKDIIAKHKDYIKQSYVSNSMGRGDIREAMRLAYNVDTRSSVKGCGHCFYNEVMPAYIKLIQEIDA